MIQRLVLVVALFTLPAAVAQTPAGDPVAKVLGWSKNANLGANLSFTSSQSVVGQTDGSSQTYGMSLKGGLNRVRETDEWRNTLSALGSTTRTPNVPRYVKSSDELKIESIYLYSLPSMPKIGPYVRAEAAAPMFKGEDVRATPSTYLVTRRDGSATTVAASSLRLTDGFKPLTTKEGVGFFWKAVQQDKLKVEARVGLAALQIDADGQFAVQGTGPAGEILVNELRDVNQAGVEFALTAKGKVDEKTSYEAGVETMTPFINNKLAGDNRDALRLTNVDGYAKLNSNITRWAAFGYDYKLKIQPQLQTRAEQIHMLVLTANYNLF
jgi:hypothetical protein